MWDSDLPGGEVRVLRTVILEGGVKGPRAFEMRNVMSRPEGMGASVIGW